MISRYVCRYTKGESPVMAIVAKQPSRVQNKAPLHQHQFFSVPMINPHMQLCNNVLLAVKKEEYISVFIKDYQSTCDVISMTTTDFVNQSKMMNISALVILEIHYDDTFDQEDNLYEIFYAQTAGNLTS